ncbi:sugar phosphate isomerase/epimerase [Amycolatopsis sp. FDAARGOS 1241]|uniref:sugar phosphate isomerase/epimerase family protein n=1 Tax=Amycolatopsis sp. FDAARGOS 1241 TaxID=2778070 RepID=UPI00194F97D8|nr:sugar phosphate isomerase/epimerase [Amycolatopsis sp. FDAARGOS 1241]QRP47896.1 sugar phosphate isomerase/epimerase [Amycolatopsis sp. FDAARGOS 1241]
MTFALVASHVTLSGSGFTEPARFSLADRCAAAAAAGFTGIGLHTNDLSPTSSVDPIRAHGLELVEIEFLSGWALGTDLATVTSTEQRAFAVADQVGARYLSAGEYHSGPLNFARAAAALHERCARAAVHGLRIAVEPFPWSAIRDVPTALRLLELADTPNAGLLLDTWHFFTAGGRIPDLARIPPDLIVAVQLNDGPSTVSGDLLTVSRNTRLLPGDGTFDLRSVIRVLSESGYDGVYTAEIGNPAFRALPVEEAAHLAYEKVQRLFT